MPMTGFVCQDEYLSKCAKLSDQEVGRLFRALMMYHSSGIAPELTGRESIAFDFIRDDVDRADKAYDAKCEKNRQSRMSAVVNERQRTSTDVKERGKTKIKDKEKEEDKDNNNDYWLTDNEIAESLERDRQIEDMAKRWGLPYSEGHMLKARDLANTYTLDWVLKAIERSGNGEKQTWAYVEGILRNWKQNGGIDTAKKPGKPIKTTGATQYTQRDYTEDELEPDWIKELKSEVRV